MHTLWHLNCKLVLHDLNDKTRDCFELIAGELDYWGKMNRNHHLLHR